MLVVRSFEELDAAARRVKGKHRALQRAVHELRRYGALPRGGPSRAAALGAVATLVRAVGPPACARRTPARCATPTARRRFPAAAITTEDADRLQRMQDRGTPVRLRLKMEAHFLPDADSFNVVGELRGREMPDEIVVDRRPLRFLGRRHRLHRRRRRLRRDVGSAAADEEAEPAPAPHGARRAVDQRRERHAAAALAYRDQHQAELANHVLMLESDCGVFRPTGFGFTGSDGRARARSATSRRCSRASTPTRSPRPAAGRHRPQRAAGGIPSMSLDVGRQLFPDPPHAGRHHRQDRSDGHVAHGGGDRGDGLCHRGNAGATSVADMTLADRT